MKKISYSKMTDTIITKRKELQLTQTQLAEKTGINRATITSIHQESSYLAMKNQKKKQKFSQSFFSKEQSKKISILYSWDFYNILEACRHSYDNGAKGVDHLVYASSSSVYGTNKKIPYSTDLILNLSKHFDCKKLIFGIIKTSNL